MSEKFILVKPGSDVRTKSFKDVIISQDYPNPKIYTLGNPAHAGIIFLNWQTTSGYLQGVTKIIDSFPHGFSYIPSVFATFKFDNGSIKREGTFPFQMGALGMITIDADINNVNVKYFSLDLAFPATDIPPFTMQIRYYLMVEPGF